MKNVMWVQGATPGASQSGHANISGTMRAGQFIGGGTGLTNVTATSLVLPFSGSVSSAGVPILDLRYTSQSGPPVIYAQHDTPSGLALQEACAVQGDSEWGFGVIGSSKRLNGVRALSDSGVALVANSIQSLGVSAVGGPNSFGVMGQGGMIGVRGIGLGATGTVAGVKGEVTGSEARGVWAHASSTTGPTYGVYSETQSSSGIGAMGFASSGTGVTVGLYGFTSSFEGTPILGRSTNPLHNRAAIKGETSGSGGIAVHGESLSITGFAIGGYFTSVSANGRGLIVENLSTAPQTVIGGDFSTAGTGLGYAVRGVTVGTGAIGVFGAANSPSGATNGVRGFSTSPAGFGVFANGALGASGTKSFVIDHPHDPENKLLRHYCAEGPAPYNIYQGEIITGADGYALVELPSYFESINKNPKIQLTVVDGSDEFVMSKVTKTVQGGRFQIRTSKPGVLVYWEVKAERNDEWVRANPPVVESDKPHHERGKYLRPELFGMPKERGVDFIPPRKPHPNETD